MDRSTPVELDVRISGHDPKWIVGLCWLLSVLTLVSGGLLVASAGQLSLPAVVMLATGGSLSAFALIFSVVLSGKRRYLRVTQSGVVYTNFAGERTFLDDDVMCVSLTSQNNYFAGKLRNVTRRFIMWIETAGIPESIVCISHFTPSQVDPLSPLIARLMRGLHLAAQEAHAQGQRVEGDGWALEKSQLLLTTRKSTSVINVSDLAAVDVGEEQIRIWRQGAELPIARIPLRTANAHLLLLLIGELIPRDQIETEANLPTGSLGRLLFERRPGSKTMFILGWILALALAVSSVVVFGRAAAVVGPRRRQNLMWLGGALGVTSLLFSVNLIRRKGGRFRRYAYGIQQRGWLGTRTIRFSEIGNMSYSSCRNHVHGVYAGTTLTMSIVPMPSTGLRAIYYSAGVKNADVEIDKLRDEVSVSIARRMHEFWSQTGQCPWMPFLRFVQDGLEYQPLTFTGRKQPKVIPYGSIVNFSIDESLFRVWVRDQRNSVINEDIGQPNFYPGLVFLSELLPSFQEGDAGALHHSDRH